MQIISWSDKVGDHLSYRGSSFLKEAKAVILDSPFKWRHFEGQVILRCVRWHLSYCLRSRDLAELMAERGLNLDHTLFIAEPTRQS